MFPKNYSDQETISAFCFNDLYNDEIFWKTTFGQPWATVLYHWLCVLKEKMLMPVIFLYLSETLYLISLHLIPSYHQNWC